MQKIFIVMLLWTFQSAFVCLAEETATINQVNAEPVVVSILPEEQIFNERLWGYLALATDNPSLCKTEFCKNKHTNIVHAKIVGEGRCEIITNEFAKSLCIKIKNSNCDSQKDAEKSMCSAIVSGDVSLVPKAYEAMKDFENEEIEDVAEIIGITVGYKQHNLALCEQYILKYVKEELPAFYGCAILLSGNPEEEFKKGRRELKVYSTAKSKGESSICWDISVQPVRQKCFQNLVKEEK